MTKMSKAVESSWGSMTGAAKGLDEANLTEPPAGEMKSQLGWGCRGKARIELREVGEIRLVEKPKSPKLLGGGVGLPNMFCGASFQRLANP
jgi:hypothetical protein